jgi:glycine C-acetyltransferase
MLGDELTAQKMGGLLLDKGVLAVGFFYPVVPKGKARIRTQVSAAHTKEDLEFAVSAFVEAKKEMGI